MPEPIPVIPLAYADPGTIERFRAWRWVNRICLIVGGFASFIAWLLLFFQVETVLGSGPVLFLTGGLMVTGGLLRRRPWMWGIGICHCAICLLFVLLVNLLHWSPADARGPFIAMGAAYNLLSLPIWIAAWANRA
jgi:hypothetical protein